MQGPIDRRSFLRRTAAAGFLAPALPLLACDPSGRDAVEGSVRDEAEGGGGGGPPASVSRPILLPWSDDAVHLWAPVSERPMAYLSRASRRIFVEHEARDRVYWLLGAHISVSSGLWRIPLPGDDPRVPIVPDDIEREFEEQPMRAWDPAARPSEGDFRIRRGAASRTRIEFACAPLSGGGAWLGAGPLEIARCAAASDGACREDFMDVGTALRYPDRACAEPGRTVRLLTWACREP